ncbi:MAG: alkaline phosphatase [Aureliella sp.]
MGFSLVVASAVGAIAPWAGAQDRAAGKKAKAAASADAPLDPIAAMQHKAVSSNTSTWGHWGPDADKYSSWKTHSSRLIPIYVFGDNLDRVRGENSIYRDAGKLEQLYGRMPTKTHNPSADYFDQTDVYRLQKTAAEAGKKRIILFVFDGTDWQTTWAAAIAKTGRVPYTSGRGTGLSFQDYRGAPTDYGYFVTSPHNDGTSVDVDNQRVTTVGGKTPGGFDPTRGGDFPWSTEVEANYLLAKGSEPKHAYTDSAASATSMTCGIKTYNDAINVDASGREAVSIARTLQEQGFAVGVVTSVPISHATPAAAYASNVHRDDYQDLTRDLIGLPSAFHPGGLPGVDVLIGGGWGEDKAKDAAQGKNFVPGNRYITAEDLKKIDAANGGKYVVAQRTAGEKGTSVLRAGVKEAIDKKERLFGYFGATAGHLPFRTADGKFDPVPSMGAGGKPDRAEKYSKADIEENPQLADMAVAAADVLQSRSDRWWLMVEAGDVDWANHANNLDNSIGALLSGEAAFTALADWIEKHGGWEDTALYLTADHGHYLVLNNPEALAAAAKALGQGKSTPSVGR